MEHRRVEDRFSFTTVLDEAAQPGARVVNFGVDGYGLDQEYLRYKKFESKDIRHVVYVFCGNDLSNLFETGLAQRDENGGVTFRPPGPRLMYHALGRLHLTYLILSGYQDLVRHIRRADHDQDQVASDLLSPRPSAEIQTVARTFLLVLDKWRSEIEMRGRTFTVLVLPRRSDTDIASQLLRGFNGRVAYMEAGFEGCRGCSFRTDAHWNEYGNLRAATVIQQDTELPFHRAFDGIDVERLMKQIDAYYQER